jgi:hypothetical protein
MGKRDDRAFERIDRDFYPTPPEGMAPLLPHIPRGATFAEPCAGAGAMVDYFESAGHPCVFAGDIEPLRPDITRVAATELRYVRCDLFITNPPWLWKWLEPIVINLSRQKPTWLLLDADLMHNLRSAKIMATCSKVVPIGRLRWVPGTPHSGLSNCCWYLFEPGHKDGPRVARRMPRL